jgi:hypothetical protein
MKNIFILLTGLLLTACTPSIALLEVDVKQPAALPVDFIDKQIAVFNTLDDSALSPETESQFLLDSLFINHFSLGFRNALETSLGLPPESIAIYNLYYNDGPRGSLNDTTYLHQLALETGANSLVLVDSLRTGDLFYLNGHQTIVLIPPDESAYMTAYAAVPCQVVLRVFDVDKSQFLAYLPGRDTVYWEFLYKRGAQNVLQLISQQRDRYFAVAVKGLGESYAQDMQAQWQTQERALFSYGTRKWASAVEDAFNFKWEKARQTWMNIATQKAGKKAAAYAAYNVAVCCEMLGQFDMAKEWLDAAQKRWNIPEIRYYRAMLEENKRNQKHILLQQKL